MRRKDNDIYNQCKSSIGFRIILEIINIICTFLCAYYFASFVDGLSSFSYKKELNIVVRLSIVFVVQLIIAYCIKCYWTAHREKVANKLECNIYRKFMSYSVRPENESKLSVVCEKDLTTSLIFYTETIPLSVQALVGMCVYIFFLGSKTDGIGILLLLIILGLFQFLPPVITEKYLIQNYVRAGQEEAQLRQQIVSGLTGIFTIKMLNLHEWFMEQYLRKQKVFQKVGERAAATSSMQTAINSGVHLIQQVGLLLVGTWGVVHGWFSLKNLIEGYVLSASFYQYMARLGMFKAQNALRKAAQERIDSLFCEPDSNKECLFSNLQVELPDEGLWLVKGKNGAGKSTFFSILNGCSPGDEHIVWKGKKLEVEERIRRIAWCPQLYQQISDSFEELSNMVPNEIVDADCLQECIKQFGIGKKLRQKPLNKLSGGEQKKLMLSLTLAKKSDILLLDEPEVSLDQTGIDILRKLLARDRRLILVATHLPIFDDISVGIIRVGGGRISV